MNDLDNPLRGLWLPLVTPLLGGSLDLPSLRRLVGHYVRLPLQGLVVAATSGEGMTLSAAELERVVREVRAAVADAGRSMPLCLGLSGAGTDKLREALVATAAWPIDGYLIASPYYLRPSQRGLLQHFAALADHAAHPIVLYNIPYRTSVNLDTDTLLALAQHPNIIGLKDCGRDRPQSIELLARRPRGFAVLTGEDTQYFEALSDGVDGAILLSAHVETATFARVQAHLAAGDRDAARAAWESVSELTCLLFAEPSPAPVKYWLARTGLIGSAEVRPPIMPVSATLARRLDAEIARRAARSD